jgi:hypothetical protein
MDLSRLFVVWSGKKLEVVLVVSCNSCVDLHIPGSTRTHLVAIKVYSILILLTYPLKEHAQPGIIRHITETHNDQDIATTFSFSRQGFLVILDLQVGAKIATMSWHIHFSSFVYKMNTHQHLSGGCSFC